MSHRFTEIAAPNRWRGRLASVDGTLPRPRTAAAAPDCRCSPDSSQAPCWCLASVHPCTHARPDHHRDDHERHAGGQEAEGQRVLERCMERTGRDRGSSRTIRLLRRRFAAGDPSPRRRHRHRSSCPRQWDRLRRWPGARPGTVCRDFGSFCAKSHSRRSTADLPGVVVDAEHRRHHPVPVPLQLRRRRSPSRRGCTRSSDRARRRPGRRSSYGSGFRIRRTSPSSADSSHPGT
jgi:hypothetical protein